MGAVQAVCLAYIAGGLKNNAVLSLAMHSASAFAGCLEHLRPRKGQDGLLARSDRVAHLVISHGSFSSFANLSHLQCCGVEWLVGVPASCRLCVAQPRYLYSRAGRNPKISGTQMGEGKFVQGIVLARLQLEQQSATMLVCAFF